MAMQFHLHLAELATDPNASPKPPGPWVRVCLHPAELHDVVVSLRSSALEVENECSFAAAVLRNRADMLAKKLPSERLTPGRCPLGNFCSEADCTDCHHEGGAA